MNAAMLCAVPWWAQGLAIIFIVVCVFLILLVLLQKGRGGGLSSAFGGEGGQSAFGSKTGDVFTWITISVVVAFGLLAMILTKTYKPDNSDELIGGQSVNSQQPVSPEPTPEDVDITGEPVTPVPTSEVDVTTEVVEPVTPTEEPESN